MSYTPRTWKNGEIGDTPLTADALNNLEDGVVGAHEALESGRLSEAGLAAAIVSTAGHTERRPVNLMEAAPTIDWAGGADSAALIQAVLDAHPGTRIDVGRVGRVRVDSTLTLGKFTRLSGNTQKVGGGPSAAAFDFSNLPGAATAINASAGSVAIEDMHIVGPGSHNTTGIGIETDGTGGSSLTLDRVTVQRFGTGIALTNQYYATLTNVEAIYNRVGIRLAGCYNVNMYRPRIFCGGTDGYDGTGIVTGTVRGLNIFGGSIEGYGTIVGAPEDAGIMVGSGSIVNVQGTYFETPEGASDGNTIAISVGGATNWILNAFGCEVYLPNHRAFINAEGAGSHGIINAGGNRFECTSSTTPAAPIAYMLGTNPALIANIGVAQEDLWAGVTLPGVAYTTGQSSPREGWSRRVPRLAGAGGGTVFEGGGRVFMPSTADRPSFRIPPGVAPSAPVNGDVWTTAAGLFVRINGATIGPLG